jgi:hypothetical protein
MSAAAIGVGGALWAMVIQSGGPATAETETAALAAVIRPQIESLPRSAFQAELLADGKLAESEYDQAFAAYSACVTSSGGRIEGPAAKNSRGVYSFSVGVPPKSAGVPNTDAIAAVQRCSSEYWDVVSQRWSAEHLTPPAEVGRVFAGIPGCMRDGGLEPPADLSRGWSSRYLRSASEADGAVLMRCLRKSGEELGQYGTVPLP